MNSPAAQALARTLLQFLWEGAAIALLLAAILQRNRSSSARVRYALACAALFAMPLAFGVTFWLSLPPVPAHVAIAPRFPIEPPILNPAPVSMPAPTQSAMLWLVRLWMTGVACFYLYGLAGWIAGQRLRRVGVCAVPEEWQRRLDALAARLRVGPHVVLLESCLANTPVVVGVLRPVILAPLGILTGLPTDQVESILIHELAHVRRHDYLVNLIQRLIEGLLFYHPAVWWISNLVRTEREFCCDDLVVGLSGDPRTYARALSTLEQRRWTQAALAANGGNLMTRIRRLLQRQEGPRIAAAPVVGLLLLLACAAFAAWQPNPKPAPSPLPQTPTPVAVPVPIPQTQAEPSPSATSPAPGRSASAYKKWMDQEVGWISEDQTQRQRLIAQAKSLPRQSAPAPAPPAATEIPAPYQKWLNEEVVYIITGNERTAFGRLMTDDERQAFIEQFWLRRDPTPGTAENEFKDEHYRRIQFVDDHFAGTQAGWMTDRGKVYISYGPPDAIDDHSGSTDTPPSQIWRYRHLDGIGDDVVMEFIDSNRTGDYRLTMDPNRIARGPVVIQKEYNGSQKTFFFFDFEDFREHNPQRNIFELRGNSAVPTPTPPR